MTAYTNGRSGAQAGPPACSHFKSRPFISRSSSLKSFLLTSLSLMAFFQLFSFHPGIQSLAPLMRNSLSVLMVSSLPHSPWLAAWLSSPGSRRGCWWFAPPASHSCSSGCRNGSRHRWFPFWSHCSLLFSYHPLAYSILLYCGHWIPYLQRSSVLWMVLSVCRLCFLIVVLITVTSHAALQWRYRLLMTLHYIIQTVSNPVIKLFRSFKNRIFFCIFSDDEE